MTEQNTDTARLSRFTETTGLQPHELETIFERLAGELVVLRANLTHLAGTLQDTTAVNELTKQASTLARMEKKLLALHVLLEEQSNQA